MKKILFIIPSLGIGGLERLQVTIANRLAEEGNDVTIMHLDECDTLKSALDPRVKLIHKKYKAHFGEKLPYIRYRLYDDGLWETRASAKTLYRYYVGNEKYDVEIAFFRGLCLKIISGSTNTDARHIAWVHSDFRMAAGFTNQFHNKEEVFKAYAGLDAVVCVSKQTEEGFIEAIGDTGNTTVIYNMLPVEEILQKAEEKPDAEYARAKFHIVLVGRFLNRVKGQRRLMRAVDRLRKNGADISLLLIGTGSEEEHLKGLIRDHHASGYMTVIGGHSNPYPFIRDADLLVCASYYEGYNLTVAEALILGVPVLSTDCSGPNEILDYGKYGMIVDNSEIGLYRGLKELYYNPVMLSHYKVRARQRFSFFNEDVIADQITALIEGK